MKCLMDLFKNDVVAGYGEGEDKLLHWGMILPHNPTAQGATSFDATYTEYNYALCMLAQLDIPSTVKGPDGDLTAWKGATYSIPNASIEPHFNAFNGGVSGYEVLILKGDKLSKYYAEMFIDFFGENFPSRRCRGVKELTNGDRGFLNLVRAKKSGMEVALLSELFFGDNSEDWLGPNDQAKFWREALDLS